MALFRRNKTTSTNIPELQEYYANQKTESTAKAWLLAIGTLLLTVAVLIGLFFGGRWVYRKATNKKDKTTTTAQTATTDTTAPGASTTPNTTTPSTSTSTTTATPGASSTTTSTTNAQGVSTTQTAATNAAATAAAVTASTVPNTGPGNTVGLFFALTAVAYFAHQTYTRRKLNK